MTDTPEEAPIVEVETAQTPPGRQGGPADAIRFAGFDTLPDKARPYLSLSRIDRPVGIWLLAIPCWVGLAYACIPLGFKWIDIVWALMFGIGAVAMRGAGCTWNDIADREIDAKVARTAGRPLPSGAVTLPEAYVWLGVQLFVGLLVWLGLPLQAKLIALAALPLVVAYPYMKRLTWWPQAWLGLTFNWGVLVAAATVSNFTIGAVVLFAALALWTIAYDTIYALQDREDDALIGVKSTARLFGDRAITGAFVFHLSATAGIALAGWLAGAGRVGAITALAFLIHGLWQSARLKSSGEQHALSVFKSNVWAGIILLAGFVMAVVI